MQPPDKNVPTTDAKGFPGEFLVESLRSQCGDFTFYKDR